jgi:hypothetical protein
MQTTRRLIVAWLLGGHLSEVLGGGGQLRMQGPDGPVLLSGQIAETSSAAPPSGHALELRDVEVIEEAASDRTRYRAARARIGLAYEAGEPPAIAIELHNVQQVQEDGHSQAQRVVHLTELQPPQEVAERFERDFNEDALLQGDACDGLGDEVTKQCRKLRKQYTRSRNDLHSEIHIRVVYSLSVVVLAVLGAALGMIFRGGQLLVAFGISFVPTFAVIMLTIAGKQTAKSEGMLLVGLAIMWGSLAAVAVLDGIVLRKYLPR